MGNKVKPISTDKLDDLLTEYDWIVAPENEGGGDLWNQFAKDNNI